MVVAEKADHTVKYRLRRLFPDNPEMEEDEELMDFLMWHNNTANYKHGRHRRHPISSFDTYLNDRFVTVVKDLTDVRLIKLLYEDGLRIIDISKKLTIPKSKVREIINGTKLPFSINPRFLQTLRSQRRYVSEDELMMHLGNYVSHLIDNDQISVPNGNPTHDTQDLVYLTDSYFTRSFTGFDWHPAFRKSGTSWYKALIRRYVELPRLRGEEPLRITSYGERPLGKGMFHFKLDGKWDDSDDRIDAVHFLADSLMSIKEYWQIQESDFRSKKIL